MKTGNTNMKIDVERNDEIGELAESFRRMVASLKIMMYPHLRENREYFRSQLLKRC